MHIKAFRRRLHAATRLVALLATMLAIAEVRPAAAQDVVDADNVVVVLDASGSMADGMGRRGSKMEVAKAALLTVMQQLPEQTRVGLLVFSGQGKAGDWVYPLAPMDLPAFERQLRPLQPNGDTPLGRYIQKGADALLAQRAEQGGYGTYRLIVVTDGEASDPDLVDRYAPRVLARGITVEVIGVAMAARHSLATQVHAYRSADDPESLDRALAASIAEVSAGGSGASDTADESGFALIAGLPDGLPDAMLTALRGSGNAPLDEATGRSASPATSAPTPGSTPDAAADSAVLQDTSYDYFLNCCCCTPVLAIGGLLVLYVIISKSKRKARGG